MKGLIVTLALAPGSMVTEKELIALAGFGRTPVREAIQKLEWQGLIAVRPRAGLQITALDPTYPALILQARRQLEPLAARLMAGGTPAWLEECPTADASPIRIYHRAGAADPASACPAAP